MSVVFPDSVHTLVEAMRYGEARFVAAGLCFGHGMDSPWDEAVYLAFYALGLPPDGGGVDPRRVLEAPERAAIARLYAARIDERRPAAYLTGEAWFAGLRLHVNAHVLIPRSPLAELVEARFEPWIDPQRVDAVLDIGTGSGCIGIACAVALPRARVDLVDVSPEALAVVRENVRLHDLEGRVQVRHSDVYSGVDARRYDLIVSNPPYVSDEEMRGLPAEYRHEPALGLRAGPRGLDVVGRILAAGHAHLRRGGILVVEVGNSQGAVEQAWPRLPFTWLEFERGGDGVFLLTQAQLGEHFGPG